MLALRTTLLLLPTLLTADSFTLTLSSRDASQSIPALPSCSCELVAFPVYNHTYSITVKAPQTDRTHVNVYLASGMCGLKPLVQGQVVMRVEGISEFKCETAVTETIYVDLVTPESEDAPCVKEKRGEERSVYLVNKSVNDFSYNMALPKNAMWVTEVLAFVLLCLLTQNIKYRRILPLTFGFAFAIVYTVLLFVTVYI